MGRLLSFAVSLALSASACGGTLYFTDFSEFPTGNNRWAGTGGWVSNDGVSGAQGIIAKPVGNLPILKAAYIGYERPSGRFTTVYRNFNHDPVASGLPIINFESLLGVQDSTNGFRDRFHVSFYNSAGNFLAAITFDNTSGFVRRDDGSVVSSTGIKFLVGDPLLGFAALQVLDVRIDLSANTWSAEIDGIPLFKKVPFTATGKPRTLGAVAAEWELAATSTLGAGNNWLLVTDWLVAALPSAPFVIKSFKRSLNRTTLEWAGQAGFEYQVLHSTNLSDWLGSLPNSTFSPSADGPLVFIDDGPSPSKFYRIRRIPSR
jgi:hypothetical protein